MKNKTLEKRAARKAHNKQIKLANEKKAIATRRQNRTYHDVNSFAKNFTMDILNLIEYKEQLRGFVKERVNMIRKFRETNHRYDNLSTNDFDECLAGFDKLDGEVMGMSKAAAAIESTTELVDKIELVNNHIKDLAELQSTVGELVNKISLADETFLNKLKGIDNPPKEPTELVSPESTEIEFEASDEDRGSGDYEADIPIDTIDTVETGDLPEKTESSAAQ